MTQSIATAAVLLQIDTPTANGRIYPREVVEKALKDMQVNLKLNRNAVRGQLGRPANIDDRYLREENVAVRYSNLRIEGDELVGDCEPFGPHGPIYADLLEKKVPMRVAMRSFVSVGSNNVVENIAHVVSFDITPDPTPCPEN